MLAIKDGRLLTMAGSEGLGEVARGTVLLDGGRIVAVGPSDEVRIPPGARIINAENHWVLPGLTDPHVHIGLFEEGVGTENIDGNEMTDPVTPQVRAIDAINPGDIAFADAVAAGYTTVLSTPGSGNIVGGQSAVMKTHGTSVDEMVILEPAGVKMAFGGNPKGQFPGKAKGKYPQTRMGIASILRQALVDAQDYLEKGKSSSGCDEPVKRDLKLEPLAKVLAGELVARIHVARGDDILTIFRLADEFGFQYTLEHVTEGHLLVEEIRDRDVPCIVGPMFSPRNPSEVKNLTFRTPGVLADAGVTVALTTDHPIVPLKHGVVQAAVAVKVGMGVDDALRALTINGARIMGVEDRVGSIEEGKDADLVIMTGHPFDLMSTVQTTIINGKVVFDRGC